MNIVFAIILAITFICGLVVLFFPFGKEKAVKANNTVPAAKSAAQVSLEEIRNQARQATAADVHVFVMWFKGFQGYRSDIPASTRYIHMLEWRQRVDELYKELPNEIRPLWGELVHRNSGGAFSEGFK